MCKKLQTPRTKKALSVLYRTIFCLFLSFAMITATGEQSQAKRTSSSKTTTKQKKPPASFYKGLEEYSKQRYGPAAEQFELADRSGYCCDNTHYYLALCYHNLNQTQRAIEHYAWVYSYSKNPTLKYQAQVGYEQVARYAGSRTYAGNGGIFAGFSGGGGGGGG